MGPVIRFLDPPHEVQTDGCVFNEPARPGFFQRKPVSLTPSAVPTITDVDIVNGCCMMIRADVFRRIGLIDERFFLIHEESDFCLRARRAGFRCGVLGEALVWHKGSSSFKRSGSRWQRYYDARNLYLLLSKHAADAPPRPPPSSLLLGVSQVHLYRYALEREAGQADAADAVVQGLYDALVGRFGPFRARPRLGGVRSCEASLKPGGVMRPSLFPQGTCRPCDCCSLRKPGLAAFQRARRPLLPHDAGADRRWDMTCPWRPSRDRPMRRSPACRCAASLHRGPRDNGR